MKTKLPEKIETEEQAKAFLQDLINNGEIYHPEDDAFDIIWNIPDMENPTFAECIQLNNLMDQIYALDLFDPCEFIIDSGCYAFILDNEESIQELKLSDLPNNSILHKIAIAYVHEYGEYLCEYKGLKTKIIAG